jgi:hypothetical protein
MTRPRKVVQGSRRKNTYAVCLDCAKEIPYSWSESVSSKNVGSLMMVRIHASNPGSYSELGPAKSKNSI